MCDLANNDMRTVFVSKPDRYLQSRIFKRNSDRLALAFGGTADQLSTQFLKAGLISNDQWQTVRLPMYTPTQKGNLLLEAILPRFAVDGGDRTLRNVCKIMSKHKHLKKLSAKILTKYGTSYYLSTVITREMLMPHTH